ncbi:MAG: hypothetical protein ACKV2V_06695 [Blastocatellia bacterium]
MKWRPGRKLRGLMLFLALSPLFLVALYCSLPWLLITRDVAAVDQGQVDVLLHCAISPRSTADEYMAALWRQGRGARIVCVSNAVSPEIFPGDFARRHLIELGVPESAVDSYHKVRQDCAAPEIRDLAAWGKARGWRSAIMFLRPEDSATQLGKAKYYFQREGISLSVIWRQQDYDELTHDWWKTHWKAQALVQSGMEKTLDALYAECR